MEIRNQSWLKLLAFCLTSAFVTALAVAILLATATLALAAGQANDSGSEPAPAARNISGVITDSYCGARHSKDSGKTSEQCTRDCVRRGAKYTLVSGEKTYTLRGEESMLEQLAGQRARLSGMLDGGMFRVNSVTAQE